MAANYLSATHEAVRTLMSSAETLPEFRKTASELSRGEKSTLVEQALLLIQENYVHLPLKESMHAVRPVQALNLLKQKIQSADIEGEVSDLAFHREMIKIFTSVRDLHTNYILPLPYAEKTAFVPFLVEPYFEQGERKYLVAHLLGGFSQPPFEPGVQIVSWNGAPIELAIIANAERFAGSNQDARIARGIERMTIRPLIQSLPPDEDFVLVQYLTNDGELHEMRVDWLVFTPDGSGTQFWDAASEGADVPHSAFAIGMDLDAQIAGLARKSLFAPQTVAAENASLSGSRKGARRRKPIEVGETVTSLMPSVLQARVVETPSGDFGHIRIRTFSVDDADRFVDEFVRLANLLPQDGLIVDVRGNGGGLIWAGEQLLQVLSPRSIEPETTQFINSNLNLELVRHNTGSNLDLGDWLESMEEAIGTGAIYSRGHPLTPLDKANALGQKYQGPVILVTDAKCYSTTDIFAAGFQDHEIGIIIGVDGNTGAGGANVWTHSLLRQFSPADAPYERLPAGANMRVAIRRTLRTGDRSGTPVEDLGVQPDILYQMTKADLLESNRDLMNFAGETLSSMPVRRLRGQAETSSDGTISLAIETAGLIRVDIYVDQRPIGAVDVEDGSTQITIEDFEDFDTIFLNGFDEDGLAAAWRI
ncbi:MAG: peptidase S41 [Alphaproteobacteria bacterium]|nr:peptidase S41 [Alphaproteobacteria bacterium]